ncbi:hypothetical protein KQI63_00165 [bacterium]|nr:hypothetical protein [bacterium]
MVQPGRTFLAVYLLLAFLLPAGGLATAPERIVEVRGFGPNREHAVQDAQRRAVEESVGIVIGGESFVRNYQMVSDLVTSRTVGFVRDYEILDEGPSGKADYRVDIRAAVQPVLDSLIADRAARDLLLGWMRIPTVRFDLLEVNVDDSTSTSAQTIIADRLTELGFRVLDDPSEGIEPDILLSGTVIAREGATPEMLKKAGMVSVQAEATLSLVQADTKDVLVSRSRMAASPHIDSKAGGARAMGEAVRPLVDDLVNDVVRIWALQRVNTLPVTITFEGAKQEEVDLLLGQLRSTSGIRTAWQKTLSDQGLTCYTEVEGTSDQVAKSMQRLFAAEASGWEVARTSWGRIDMVRASQ